MIKLINFKSKILKNKRRIFIYLPPNSDILRGPSLPVLYMQDGQNLFSNTCHEVPWQWNIDEVADKLIKRGKIPRMLIVGLANTSARENEYTHAHCPHFKTGGNADRYLDFVTEEVMPFVKNNFPVNPLRQATGFGGSSLGGLLSLYAAFTRPESFGRFIATSPSIWWDNFSIFDVISSSRFKASNLRLWVDIGTREMKAVRHKKQLFRPLKLYRSLDLALCDRGFEKSVNYHYYEERLGTHDERSWNRRMRRALPFLYKDMRKEKWKLGEVCKRA